MKSAKTRYQEQMVDRTVAEIHKLCDEMDVLLAHGERTIVMLKRRDPMLDFSRPEARPYPY